MDLICVCSCRMHPSFELEALEAARFEAEIASQSSAIIVHSSKPISCVDCTAIALPTHSSSLLLTRSPRLYYGFLPETVGELSSQNAHWLYDLLGPSTSCSLSPTPFYFSMGNQPSQNLGKGVFGSLSCDIPHEFIRDGLVMSVGPNYGPTMSNFLMASAALIKVISLIGLSFKQMANRLTHMSTR